MEKLNLKDVLQYVEDNIGVFHQRRIQSLDGLKLAQVLKRKNPYLFKAKYVLTAEQIWYFVSFLPGRGFNNLMCAAFIRFLAMFVVTSFRDVVVTTENYHKVCGKSIEVY
jgi:hypothetical protein